MVHFHPLKVVHFEPLRYAHFNPLKVVYYSRFLHVMKSVYLALNEATKKWTMPIHNWGLVLSQFMIIFEKRLRL